MEEEQLTRRESLKELSTLAGTILYIPSAFIAMYGALENDIQRAEGNMGIISKKPENYMVRKGLLGGLISSLLIYYGTRKQ